ncbi:hypothetical protein Hanom_Chr10g00938481 [Helianthus anomalus]
MQGLQLVQKEVLKAVSHSKFGPKTHQFAKYCYWASHTDRKVLSIRSARTWSEPATFFNWQFRPLSFVRDNLLLILTRKPPNLVFKNLGTFTNMVMSSDNFALNRKAMKFDVDAFNPSSTVLAITFSYVNETSRNFYHIF